MACGPACGAAMRHKYLIEIEQKWFKSRAKKEKRNMSHSLQVQAARVPYRLKIAENSRQPSK
jgi:hypothetical protein